jgi:orotidine-5'-phosphate decarboxylase
MGIIPRARSIIPSTDVKNIGRFKELIKQTYDRDEIGGYKLNSGLAILHGLPKLVKIVRTFTDKPVIYDHQKWMTDIPEGGQDIIDIVKKAGANAIIGYPESGPATQEAYIKACQKSQLGVLTGGEMTHPKYKISEGGYIADEALDRMYLLSARLGITDFVVPGNKKERLEHYLKLLKPEVNGQISFWAPGFVAQGGSISDALSVAGKSFHAIVGRGIYQAKDMHAAALDLASQIK